MLFYSIEKAIKSYRRFAQRELKKNSIDITVDQWLTLSVLSQNPDIQQKDLADLIFKDNASVTRIISLLIKSGLLKRASHGTDKRRTLITITVKGNVVLKKARKVVSLYRSRALKDIKASQIETARYVMNVIIKNCR